MQVVNSPNTSLYPVETPSQKAMFGGHEIKIELYDSDGDIEQISAFTFHPYQTTFWETIKNWFIEFFYGKTVVLIKVDGYSSPLFARVDQIAEVLKVKPEQIRKSIKKVDATSFLVFHQMKKTAKKIQEIANMQKLDWSTQEIEGIREVIKKFGYKNIYQMIDQVEFDTSLLILTLAEVGHLLKNDSLKKVRPKNYSFEIALPNVYIWKVENYQKIKINLKDLELTIEQLPKNPMSLSTPINTKIKNPLISFIRNNLYSNVTLKHKQEFGLLCTQLKVDSKHLKYLHALANRVNYVNLISVLNNLEKDPAAIMMRTFVEIGRQFSAPAALDKIFAHFRLSYVKKKKKEGKPITFAFAISKTDIFITQEKFAEGGYKAIAHAIKLNQLNEPFVRIKTKSTHCKNAIGELKKEADFLNKLHQKEKNYGIVVPYACEIFTKGKKEQIILFQKQYTDDGCYLFKAPAIHQINALKGVASGLTYMHELNYIHMDVKTRNIFIKGNISGDIPVEGEIGDFGMTVKKGLTIIGGTPFYLPPEAIDLRNNELAFNLSCQVNEKVDSFSLGVTIIEILTGNRPNYVLGLLEQKFIDLAILDLETRLISSYPFKEATLKIALLKIAQALLCYDPQKRISCAEATQRLEVLQNWKN